MPEIKLKARIQNKYNTLEEWNKLTKGEFIPLKGEVCYTIDNNMLYQKIGDGKTDFTDLAWLVNQADWNESNENAPSYVKNKLGYKKFDTEKSELYKYTFSNQGEEYPKFQLETVEGLGTIGIMTDYFDNTAKTDFTFYINNQTLPYLELTDLTITKSVIIEDTVTYYTGNIYPLAIALLDFTEEDLVALGVEKTEDSYGFIYTKTEEDFVCYIWMPEIYTSYYQLVISGYNFQIVPIPEEFLGINYDQFVGRYDVSNTYGEIFNDYVNNKASGSYSHAEGYSNSALGYESHAEGNQTSAIGSDSHTEGSQTSAFGNQSHAEGWGYSTYFIINDVIKSSYDQFKVPGNQFITYDKEFDQPIIISYQGIQHINILRNISYNDSSNETTFVFLNSLPNSLPSSFEFHIFKGTAVGTASHAEGKNNYALGDNCHAEGKDNKSEGDSSHTEGYNNIAKDNYSHAEGNSNTAMGEASHAEGKNNKVLAETSHVEGSNNIVSGKFSHSEGRYTEANDDYSHSEGYNTRTYLKYAHAEGINRIAIGNGAHAEGDGDLYIGQRKVNIISSTQFTSTFNDPKEFYNEFWDSVLYAYISSDESYPDRYIEISKVELNNNIATFTTRTTMSYTIGASKTFYFRGIGKANGDGSHIEGWGTTVFGKGAHAEGVGTIGSGEGIHVQGRYNVLGNYAHIIGNGTGVKARSNAHTLDWNGNAWYAGTVQATDFLDAEGNSFMDKVNNHINEVIGGIENGSY